MGRGIKAKTQGRKAAQMKCHYLNRVVPFDSFGITDCDTTVYMTKNRKPEGKLFGRMALPLKGPQNLGLLL